MQSIEYRPHLNNDLVKKRAQSVRGKLGLQEDHSAPATSSSRTGNSDWLQQISWPLIGSPAILTFHRLLEG